MNSLTSIPSEIIRKLVFRGEVWRRSFITNERLYLNMLNIGVNVINKNIIMTSLMLLWCLCCFLLTCLEVAVHMKIVFSLFSRLTEKTILFPRFHILNISPPGRDLFWLVVGWENFERSQYSKRLT